MSAEPFWMAPRRLRRLLEDGELTTTEYALLHYLAEAGADREEGFSTTRALLETLLDVSRSTVLRATRKLRDLGLIELDVRERQHGAFRVLLGPSLVSRDTRAVTPGLTPGPGVTSETLTPGEAASAKGFPGVTPGVPRARAETETEKVLTTNAAVGPGGGGENLTEEEPPAFTEAVAELRPVGAQRGEWLTAFTENESGFRSVLAEALEVGDPAEALLTAKLRAGAHRPAERSKRQAVGFRALVVQPDGSRDDHGVYPTANEAEAAAYAVVAVGEDGLRPIVVPIYEEGS